MWKKEYINLLFPERSSDVQLGASNVLKAAHIPARLFKYRCFDEANRALQCLEENTLYCVKAALLNDPYECAVCLSGEDFDFLQEQDINRRFSEVNSERLYICSLSEVGDSPLMWSHYADEHRGFCIEYNLREVETMFCRQFLYPVVYQSTPPDLSPYFRHLDDYNFLTRKYYAMVKGCEWEYEKEWRLIMPFDIGDISAVPMRMPQPKAVYAGCRTSNENIEKLKRIMKGKNTALYQMVKDEYSYALHRQPIVVQ